MTDLGDHGDQTNHFHRIEYKSGGGRTVKHENLQFRYQSVQGLGAKKKRKLIVGKAVSASCFANAGFLLERKTEILE